MPLRNLYCLIFWYVLFTIQSVQAQVITVVDQNTLQPIEDVLISNDDKSIALITNHLGKTPDQQLPENSLLTLNHPGYETTFINLDQLKASKFLIAIRQRIIMIDEVVIAANRWEQEKKYTPNRIVSIRPSQTELNNPQTTADMLAFTNQVFVQKSQLGGGSPMIRGFAANSVLIVVDGVRMNNAIFRSGNLQNVISIDPFTLESTEVLFGPGSVMYGSDALGGVMHFRTKSPGFINQGTQINASSTFRYSTANNEKTGHIDLSIRGKNISYYGSITYSDFNHLKTGDNRTSEFPDYGKRFQYVQTINGEDRLVTNPDYNEQIFSGYNQVNLLNKLSVRLGGKADLSYTLNYSTTSDIPRYDRLTEPDDNGGLKVAEWYYGPQKWLSNSLHLNLYHSNALYDGAKVILALQNLEESRHDRDFGSDWLRNRSEQVDVLTLNLDLEKSLNDKNTMFYGVEWFNNQVDSKAHRVHINNQETAPIRPRYPNGGSSYTGLAAYITNKWMPNSKVAVTGGLRYNQIWLEANYNNQYTVPQERKLDLNNNALNGSLGVSWLPGKEWQVNGLFSTGFRAPNVDDIGKVFDGTNGVVTVPNPELEPEYSYNWELGLIKSINEKFRFSVTGYFTYLDNAIVQNSIYYHGLDSIYFDGELSKTQALVNSNSAKIYGGNMQLEVALTPELNLNSSYTVTKGEDSEDTPLRHTTPNFGYIGLLFQKQQFTGELSYRFSGKREFDDLPPIEQYKTHLYTEDGSLAWQSLNLSGTYHVSKFLTFTFGIENILDHHYRPYSSGISAAGRNYILGITGRL